VLASTAVYKAQHTYFPPAEPDQTAGPGAWVEEMSKCQGEDVAYYSYPVAIEIGGVDIEVDARVGIGVCA
jgi:hypothetical protein